MLIVATSLLLLAQTQAPLDAEQEQQLAAARAFFAPGARNPDSSRHTIDALPKKCGFAPPLTIDASTIPVARTLASKPANAPDLVWSVCLALVESVIYSCEKPELAAGIREKVKRLECRARADGPRHGAYTLNDGTLTMTFGAAPATDMDTVLGRGQAFLEKNARATPAIEAGLSEPQQNLLNDVRKLFAPDAKNPDSSRFAFKDFPAQCGFSIPIAIDKSTLAFAEKSYTDDAKKISAIHSRCLAMAEAVMYTCREHPEQKAALQKRVTALSCRAEPGGEAHGSYRLEGTTLVMTFGDKPATDMDTILARGQAFLAKTVR